MRSTKTIHVVSCHAEGEVGEMLDPDDPWPEGYRLSDTWPEKL